MGAVTLSADEHRQWETAVATWPICRACRGLAVAYTCSQCVAGRVPQPVYIVIEGVWNDDHFIPPARWVSTTNPWNAPLREPCEIRAECPWCAAAKPTGRFCSGPTRRPDGTEADYGLCNETCPSCRGVTHSDESIVCATCDDWRQVRVGSVLLASAATVEVHEPIADGFPPDAVRGRHFVAVVTP